MFIYVRIGNGRLPNRLLNNFFREGNTDVIRTKKYQKDKVFQQATALLLLGTLLLIFLVSCKDAEDKRIKEQLFALDTYITFTVSIGEQGEKETRAGLNSAMQRIQEIEQRMSVTIADSDISKINDAAGKEPVKVHSDTFFVIQKAIEYGELTHGCFDISILPIVRTWNISSDNPRVPNKEEVDQVLSLIDYKKIKLNEQEQTVFLEEEGMAVDLGGIAKGYAGDEAVRILKEHGVSHALINLGGNIAVIGGKEDGSPWRIGIQNPRMEEDSGKRKHVAAVPAIGKAVVTSGDYERYMVDIYEQTGERYHHIFDPATGYPVNNGIISVTIVTENGIDADALTTALFVMGVESGLELADKLEGVDAMIITEDKLIHLSKGFEDQVSDIHPDYHIDR